MRRNAPRRLKPADGIGRLGRVAGAFSVPVTALVMYAFLFEIIRNLDEPEVKVLKRADYRFSDLKLYHLSYRSGFLPSCIAFVHR